MFVIKNAESQFMRSIRRVNNCKSSLYYFLSSDQISVLDNYLRERLSKQKKKNKFSVVFDLLHQCDINCIGCGTDAICVNNIEHIINPELSFENVVLILRKIKEYAQITQSEVFVNFGGGEPFLRSDIISILQEAANLFGIEGVGIDTNASLLDSYDLLVKASKYVSYIGISINGLQEYHNWWANCLGMDAYTRAMGVVKKLCEDCNIADKIEVTSVATTKNIEILPELMEILAGAGVKKYSIHRAISVGRMSKLNSGIIPSWKQYVELLVKMITKAKELEIDAHLNHSIESIHGTLLCGINTYDMDKMLDKNNRSSIGIEPNGDLIIDPWCTSGYWKKLSLGNVLSPDITIDELISKNSNILEQIRKSYDAKYRCGGCKEKCSGGSRIVSASKALNGRKESVELEDILEAFRAVDPACPLEGGENSNE